MRYYFKKGILKAKSEQRHEYINLPWTGYKVHCTIKSQTVLLYGRESWVVKGEMLNILEGFHHQAARRIVGITEETCDRGDTGISPGGGGSRISRIMSYTGVNLETTGNHRGTGDMPPHQWALYQGGA